ncbi:pre-mRNA-splicing factor 18 [Geosmithia morbida]|uniref:Pre-mRNA-splicing factor 18 n=1 Tax=Geosmithia morbida TaxID=1094350 RepID=A0A9P4YPG5_9HYPO|nr:pre-mRNA-splicing factor 18 [Geosmithia morbida]KAF4120315.1 pre-mRNA-splicing factor 18 [Geosmithia morbida]
MDFAALMGKELSKSKKAASGGNDPKKKKFMRRADIEAEREAAYRAEQKALEEERQAKVAAKRKREEDAAAEHAAREEKRQRLAEESRRRRQDAEWEEEQARRRRLGLPEKPKPSSAGDGDGTATSPGAQDDGAQDVPEEELIAKLRGLGHPAILFGEGHAARLRRYRRLTTVLTDGPIPTTLQPVDEKDMKVGAAVPKDRDGRRWLYRQLASYFTMVLTEYQRAMEAERRDTTASKNAYNAMVQTKENMKPTTHVSYIGNSNEMN